MNYSKNTSKVYYIGHSTDYDIRYESSSGGVATAIIKYLLEKRNYGTSMTFVFDREKHSYKPKLIYSFKDYNNCGSIYQETDTIGFIKENINNIRNGIILTCMPCQVRIIRSLLNKNRIKHFIISLCCSGQTTVQGTWFYYKLLNIRKEDVKYIRYRGNGWPSGIQIELTSGNIIKKANYTYPWTIMHQSMLFRPKRCLSCTIKTSPYSDITLADPWLKEYLENDKVGNSIVICNDVGDTIIKRMKCEALLNLREINEDTFTTSQLGTIQIKAKANNRLFKKIVEKMAADDSFYKSLITSSIFMLKIHCRILRIIQFVFNHS